MKQWQHEQTYSFASWQVQTLLAVMLLAYNVGSVLLHTSFLCGRVCSFTDSVSSSVTCTVLFYYCGIFIVYLLEKSTVLTVQRSKLWPPFNVLGKDFILSRPIECLDHHIAQAWLANNDKRSKRKFTGDHSIERRTVNALI